MYLCTRNRVLGSNTKGLKDGLYEFFILHPLFVVIPARPALMHPRVRAWIRECQAWHNPEPRSWCLVASAAGCHGVAVVHESNRPFCLPPMVKVKQLGTSPVFFLCPVGSVGVAGRLQNSGAPPIYTPD